MQRCEGWPPQQELTACCDSLVQQDIDQMLQEPPTTGAHPLTCS